MSLEVIAWTAIVGMSATAIGVIFRAVMKGVRVYRDEKRRQ